MRLPRFAFSLVIFIMGGLGVVLSACSEAPQCVPGRTVACPCVPTGQGVQRCAEDGSRYLECECGHLPSPIRSFSEVSRQGQIKRDQDAVKSLDTQSKNPLVTQVKMDSSPLLSQTLPSRFTTQGTAEAATITQTVATTTPPKTLNEPQNTSKFAQVVPLEAEIKEVNDGQNLASPQQSATKMFKFNLRNQQKEWWFYSETLERCVLADNVNGIDYAPLKLLSEGCYRLGGEGLMVIRCDDPPLGPKTYRFAERERDCIRSRSEQQAQESGKRSSNVPSQQLEISVLDPVIEAKDEAPLAEMGSSQAVSDDERSWHCMCYEEVVKGEPTLSTACRPSQEMCKDLSDKVEEGSKILVKGSVLASCQERRGSSPWRLFQGKGSRRYFWQPSSHPGAWWSSEGCFLPISKQKRSAWNAKRSSSRSDRALRDEKKRGAQEETPPPELFEPIGSRKSLIRFGEQGSAPRSEKCREACRANLVSSNELRAEYGTNEVPPLLRWGKTFSDRVKLVKTICMSNQGKAKRGREQCLQKVINKCSIYCERAEE